MSDYTPTTEEVREVYAGDDMGIPRARFYPEFDRWLASVKAEALREAVRESDEGRRSPKPETSWRKYLLDRADAIERGET